MLAGLFNNKKKAVLGVDITSKSVKLLELSRQGNQYQVEAYAKEPLPADAIVEQNVNDEELVGQTIGRALLRSRSKNKTAAIAVTGASVITKVIQMSADLSEDELEQQIQLEADKYIPYPLEEVAMDFDIIGRNEDNKEFSDVLLAACRKENVERREDAVEIGGLKTEVVDVEAYALERAFSLVESQLAEGLEDEQPLEVVAIFDVGSSSMTLSVLNKGRITYTREQAFGGDQLTEDIQRRYGMSFEDAEKAKLEGGLPDDYHYEVLIPFKEGLVQQISRALQFFYSSSDFNDVDRILLAGGVSSMEDIADLVTEKIGTVAIAADPFKNMSIGPKVQLAQLKQDASSLMVACGLAMRGLE